MEIEPKNPHHGPDKNEKMRGEMEAFDALAELMNAIERKQTQREAILEGKEILSREEQLQALNDYLDRIVVLRESYPSFWDMFREIRDSTEESQELEKQMHDYNEKLKQAESTLQFHKHNVELDRSLQRSDLLPIGELGDMIDEQYEVAESILKTFNTTFKDAVNRWYEKVRTKMRHKDRNLY